MEQHFLATVALKDGRRTLQFASGRWLRHHLGKYPVGTKVSVLVTDKRPKRSDRQHRYYWAYLGLIADSTGHSKDDLHTFFKGKFLSEGITELWGYPVRKVKSTTTLTKGQFAEYITEIWSLTGIDPPDAKAYELASTNPMNWNDTSDEK
jgi:hypothetical protein